MTPTARRTLAAQLAQLIPPTAPRPAADAPAAAWNRPAWLAERRPTGRPAWLDLAETPRTIDRTA